MTNLEALPWAKVTKPPVTWNFYVVGVAFTLAGLGMGWADKWANFWWVWFFALGAFALAWPSLPWHRAHQKRWDAQLAWIQSHWACSACGHTWPA